MQVKDDLLRVVQDAVEGLARVSVTRGMDNGMTASVSLATADGHTYQLEVLWAGEGWPSDLRRILAHVPTGEWPRHVAVVARNLSPGALGLLEERDANWIDQDGHVRLVVPPGLLVYRERLPVRPPSPPPTFKWSRSAVRLAEYMLGLPLDQPLKTGELAEDTGWSPGRVSTVLQAFDSLEWTESKGAKSGPGAWRRLINAGAMLDSWAAYAGDETHRRRLAHHNTRDLLRFTETELRTNLGRDDDRTWALTTWSGLELAAPFATAVPVIHIYLSADRFRSEVDQIMRSSGLREVDEGARFEFWEAEFPLRTQPGQPSRTPVVATPRLYADLLVLGARGADAAQHLRETKLDF
ncbi:hypothetical protein BH23ACT5_BH23ACT5_06760 [soil metagenome]